MPTLVEIRTSRQLTQEAFAAELSRRYGVRISSKTISAWERGFRTPRLAVARLVADFVGVPLHDLQFASVPPLPLPGEDAACEQRKAG